MTEKCFLLCVLNAVLIVRFRSVQVVINPFCVAIVSEMKEEEETEEVTEEETEEILINLQEEMILKLHEKIILQKMKCLKR
jgi:hypothetical protein